MGEATGEEEEGTSEGTGGEPSGGSDHPVGGNENLRSRAVLPLIRILSSNRCQEKKNFIFIFIH